METFPEKIPVAVFLAALMPGPTFSANTIYTETCNAVVPELDNRVIYDNGPENPPTTLILELVLLRKRYRSVRRVYIIAVESKGLTKEFQRWMIENNPPDEVEEISGSDHMVMMSKPEQLLTTLLRIANSYI
ncbi:hypothetical protein T459_31729 [Capsicum annuum]|uniref:Salicylic acid-binding protein 2-like n=1 Tax=Capsicum annuum TaxID=4072 RepID=A0A2G2Y3S3_CAPAN|nr:hypothetical protein T459_31729 [Capsicum annuum]